MGFDDRRRGGRREFGGRRGGFDDEFSSPSDFGDRGRGRGRGGGGDFGGPPGGFGGPPGGYGGGFGAPPGGGYGGGGGGGFGGPRRPFTPPRELGQAKGVVKFFNASKGFGFIVRDDGGEDVFVHISAVEQAGLTGLADGQPLEFTLSERNGRISATNLIIEGEPMPVVGGGGAGGGSRGGPPQREISSERMTGTVKFFNATKGFGFIARDDGGQDAFVHISAVERSGLQGLAEGQKVSFQLETDRRGKQAAVNLLEA